MRRLAGTGRTMSVKDAAAALEVHPNTIRNMVLDGRLTDVSPAPLKVIRLDPAEVQRLL